MGRTNKTPRPERGHALAADARGVRALAVRPLLLSIALTTAGVGVLVASAWVSVPFYPVPLTLQTLAVLLVGGFLGPRLGVAAVTSYIALGLTGAPIFHGGLGGPALLAGPTGGYLVGFIPAAFLMGLAARTGWKFATGRLGKVQKAALLVVGALAAEVSIYALGLPWLAFTTVKDAGTAVSVGLVPFVLGDLVKAAVAVMSVYGGKNLSVALGDAALLGDKRACRWAWPRKVADHELTILEAFILGLTQGLTEFLPVSSSGHLVLVPEFFNLTQPTVGFDIVLHLATLLAVVAYFFRDVQKMVVALFASGRMSGPEVKYWRRLFLWLVIGSIPAAIAGFGFEHFFEGLIESTIAVGIFLLVTSALLFGSDYALDHSRREPAQLGKMRAADALIIGCFQALAIAPGLSRSGSTVSAGLFLGFDRPTAARFSFLLSIPAILGAFVAGLSGAGGGFGGTSIWAYLVGAATAAVTGFLAVYLLMRLIRNHRFRVFAIYTAVLGLFVIIVSAL